MINKTNINKINKLLTIYIGITFVLSLIAITLLVYGGENSIPFKTNSEISNNFFNEVAFSHDNRDKINNAYIDLNQN